MKRKGEEESRKREKGKERRWKMEQERRRFEGWVKGVIKEAGR